MDQGGRLQRVSGGLAMHAGAGEFTQFLVENRQQGAGSVPVTATESGEELRDLIASFITHVGDRPTGRRLTFHAAEYRIRRGESGRVFSDFHGPARVRLSHGPVTDRPRSRTIIPFLPRRTAMSPSSIKKMARVAVATALSMVLWLQPGLPQDQQPPGPAPAEVPVEAPQEAVQPVVLSLDSAIELLANGDATAKIVLDLPEEKYAQAKRLMPDAHVFIRDMRPGRADWELAPESTCTYDDASHSLLMNLRQYGAVRNEGSGKWSLALDEGMNLVEFGLSASGRSLASFRMDGHTPDGLKLQGPVVYTLPAGAHDPAYDARDRKLIYALQYTGPRGEGRLDVRFDARDQLMSALYKVYGLKTKFAAQWVAKMVVKNTGDGPLSNLRIRYRVSGYSEWSLWDKYPEVLPGQTVSSSYHPVLSREIAALHSTTPANVHVEWSYQDSSCQVHEDSDGERIAILGVHEFIFSNLTESESTGAWFDFNSNAPFLAAWVSRDDPVIARFSSMANKLAGGEGAPYSDEAAVRVLGACYDLMLANDFTYQGPKSVTDDTSNFDAKIVQSIKFPRDVIRDRSGTCVELTGLYASMAHAVGLKPYIVLVPGHAFPAIQLPSGKIFAVETTGVAGGLRGGAKPFDQVVQQAMGSMQRASEDGRFIIVDVERLWTWGVSNPELAELSANILDQWGIQAVALGPQNPDGPFNPGPGPQVNNTTFPNNTPVQQTTRPGSQLSGLWSGTATSRMPDGTTVSYPIEMTITDSGSGGCTAQATCNLRLTNDWGFPYTVVIRETFQGSFSGQQLQLRGSSKSYSILETGEVQQVNPDTLIAEFRNGELTGRAGSDLEGWVTFTLRRASPAVGGWWQ